MTLLGESNLLLLKITQKIKVGSFQNRLFDETKNKRGDITAVRASRSSRICEDVYHLLTKPYYLIDRVSYICSS